MVDVDDLIRLVPDPLVDAGGAVVTDVTVVNVDAPTAAPTDRVAEAARHLGLTVGVTRRLDPSPAVTRALTLTLGPLGSRDPAVVPVADPEAALELLRAATAAAPVAARSLDGLLRLTAHADPSDGLAAESFAYSTLLGGPEFAAWLRSRGAPRASTDEPATLVRMARRGTELDVRLARPHRRNAYNSALRDALVDALTVAAADDTVTHVHLYGDGPVFCSGGDLDEFGTAADPAVAHLVRLGSGAGRLMHALRGRLTAHVHGSCVGAGVELPAFAGRVLARPGTTFRLPEVAMGLVPGAGGTVSITARIGRWRTAYLALSGITLDLDTALTWGLVDDVDVDG